MNPLTALTLISLAVAATMTVIVLRLVFQERRRSAARVAALEADIYRTEEEDILLLHDPPLLSRNGERSLAEPAPRTIPLAALVAVVAAIAFAILAGMSRYRAESAEPARSSAALPADQALQLL